MKQPSLATHKKPDHFDQLPLVRNKLIQFRRGLIFANDYIPIEKQFRQKHRQANPCAKEQYLQKSWDETKKQNKIYFTKFVVHEKVDKCGFTNTNVTN